MSWLGVFVKHIILVHSKTTLLKIKLLAKNSLKNSRFPLYAALWRVKKLLILHNRFVSWSRQFPLDLNNLKGPVKPFLALTFCFWLVSMTSAGRCLVLKIIFLHSKLAAYSDKKALFQTAIEMNVIANGQLSPCRLFIKTRWLYQKPLFLRVCKTSMLVVYMSHFPIFKSYAWNPAYLLYTNGNRHTFTLNSHFSGSSISSGHWISSTILTDCRSTAH